MAQKNATPSKAQQEILKRNSLEPLEWVVIKELNHSMIIRQRSGTEVRIIDK